MLQFGGICRPVDCFACKFLAHSIFVMYIDVGNRKCRVPFFLKDSSTILGQNWPIPIDVIIIILKSVNIYSRCDIFRIKMTSLRLEHKANAAMTQLIKNVLVAFAMKISALQMRKNDTCLICQDHPGRQCGLS